MILSYSFKNNLQTQMHPQKLDSVVETLDTPDEICNDCRELTIINSGFEPKCHVTALCDEKTGITTDLLGGEIPHKEAQTNFMTPKRYPRNSH